MANVQKYNKSAVGHLLNHYERSVDEKGQHIKYGNQDIKTDLSAKNYNLGPDRDMDQLEFIKKRTSEVSCLNRKDVNVMCSWVVTLPKTLPVSQEREFFEKTYDFLQKRYGGEENVVSSYVHLDENQPHMHFSFVPVVHDKKKDHLKVSAKEAVSKADLQTFHKDLSKAMELHFKKDIGILNESTKEGNKSILELKRDTVITEIENQKFRLEKDIKSLENTKGGLQGKINTLENDLNRLKNNFKVFDDVKSDLDKIDSLEMKLGALNKNKVTLNVGDLETLKKLAKKSIVLESDLNILAKEKFSIESDFNKAIKLLDKQKEKYQNISKKYDFMEKEVDHLRDFLKKEGILDESRNFVQDQKNLEKSLKPNIQDLEI